MYYGSEYISGALPAWAEREGIRIERIQPGKPQQNAYVERYNRTVRHAWLARTSFDSIERVQDKATRWLWTYNHERPNTALGGITPMQKLALRSLGGRFHQGGLQPIGRGYAGGAQDPLCGPVPDGRLHGRRCALKGCTRQMKTLPAFLRKSLTCDRGSEMACHARLANA